MNQKQIEEIEEAVLRLHCSLRRWDNENDGFRKVIEKIEKKGISVMTQKDKIMLSLWGNAKWEHGKLYAYMFILRELGQGEVPNVIERLRGIKQISEAKAIETK